MALSSFNILHVCLALLVGVYLGINLSGLHTASVPPSTIGGSSKGETSRSRGNDSGSRSQQKAAADEARRWQEQARKLEVDYASSLDRLHQLEESCAGQHEEDDRKEGDETEGRGTRAKAEDASSSSRFEPGPSNPHPVCRHLLPEPAPTATALWFRNLGPILAASRVPNDRQYKFHDFTAQLLQIVSPRLARSVRTVPHDWRPVERALTVAWERYQYLQLTPDERRDRPADLIPPRPLRVLVMGGSLLVGTNCRNLKTELGLPFQLPKRDCTWSSRVGQFLNAYASSSTSSDEPLVEVTKVAMGGTNTATGSVIWQYDLIPEEARNPDVVLNAYSTNDMHILTILEAQSSNTTLRDRTFDMTQTFVRQVLETTRCPSDGTGPNDSPDADRGGGGGGGTGGPIPPLLLHIDDYLGNEQRKVWETTELAQGVQVLATYYGFATMSYADVVRDLVYGDTYETWLSSEWWKPPPKKEKKSSPSLSFEREIHPGMGMHIASTWVVVYNLLHLATAYCSLPTPHQPHDVAAYESGLWGLPPLRNDVPQAKGKPRAPPGGLPPVLTKDLLLEDVTSLWRSNGAEGGAGGSGSCTEHAEGRPSRVKCPFSWVSGLSLQQNNQTWIQEYFQQRSSTWKGWTLSEDGGKVGFVPTAAGSTDGSVLGTAAVSQLVLDFSFSQSIRSITFFYMKSYGTKWSRSQLEAKIWLPAADGAGRDASPPRLLEERHMMGSHNKNTSEMYTEEIVLHEPVQPGGTLQLAATLVGGEMFKILGLAVCS